MSNFLVVVDPPVPGESGPGTLNNKQGWTISWDSRTRPGKRAASLSYATQGVASRVAERLAKKETNVVVRGRWIGGWL